VHATEKRTNHIILLTSTEIDQKSKNNSIKIFRRRLAALKIGMEKKLLLLKI